MFHPELMITEILKVFVFTTDENNISLQLLEKAFNALREVVCEMGYDISSADFQSSLQRLINAHPNIRISDDVVVVDGDIIFIYEEIYANLNPSLTDLDLLFSKYVQNSEVYSALELFVSDAKLDILLFFNWLLIQLYLVLAYKEHNKQSQEKLKDILDRLKDSFQEKLDDLDKDLIQKLKVFCAFYDLEYLGETKDKFSDEMWYIILFKGNSVSLKCLEYEWLKNVAVSSENGDLDDFLDSSFEIPDFLTHFLFYLIVFIESNSDKNINEGLIIIKYLLLSLPELREISDKYFDGKWFRSADELPDVSEETLEILLDIALQCANLQNYDDSNITENASLYSGMIVRIIFLKCFLSLVLDDDLKENIQSSDWFNNPNYEILNGAFNAIIPEMGFGFEK